MILDQTKGLDLPGIGLLLDQEKVYDRAHPGYLCQVMLKFAKRTKAGRPAISFTVQISIGTFTAINTAGSSIPRIYIHHDASTTADSTIETTTTVKLLAYADDVGLLLKDSQDFYIAQSHMQRDTSVSNAKFNVDKTESFSLNGKQDTSWQSVLANNNISQYTIIKTLRHLLDTLVFIFLITIINPWKSGNYEHSHFIKNLVHFAPDETN
ncbi:hypothetical protein MFLAVUS_010079 [Mucor flavus]|uniref:Reverse transcriptase domain-containing protein n=1 Tax=Mucor flavus TaxID=439312 RepID=A0ABP9ZBY6_9FUNG